MDSKLVALISIAMLFITGVTLVLAATLPQRWRWPWLRYRANLRWYRQSEKHLLYVIGGKFPAPAVVIHGFNYMTGRVKVRHMRAVRGGDIVREYNANEITPVVYYNTTAKENTLVT